MWKIYYGLLFFGHVVLDSIHQADISISVYFSYELPFLVKIFYIVITY